MFFWRTSQSTSRREAAKVEEEEPTLLDLLLPKNPSVNWNDVESRSKARPHELKLRSAQHSLLFLALQRDAPDHIIEGFLDDYPAAAREVQRIGLTPLHLAVARGCSLQCIRYILQAWPQACLQKMNDGSVPLHFVRTIEIAKLLIKSYPSALHIPNKASYLPLHRVTLAAYSYASPELVQFLVDADALKSQLVATTCQGMTALDVSMKLLRETFSLQTYTS